MGKNREVIMKKVKKYHIFIIFIFCFPILMECLSFLFSNGVNNIVWNEVISKTLDVIKKHMSFYATALTISFTVYTFTKSQEKIEKDRLEEKEKEREIRTKEKEKELEIRKKELEDKRDFYRPTFIVEKNLQDNSYYVKLLMRSSDLYLEDIKYYSDSKDTRVCVEKSSLKSGEIIARKNTNSFYIIAKTQIGENILFGYLNGGIKVHKYLKEGGNTLIPQFYLRNCSQDKINQNWGTYNTDKEDRDEILDQIFFYNTTAIREVMVLTYYESLKNTLTSTTADKFFKNVFQEIVDEHKRISYDKSRIINILEKLLDTILSNKEYFNVNYAEIDTEYIEKQLEILTDRNVDLTKLLKERMLMLELKHLLYEIKYADGDEKYKHTVALLSILVYVFKFITVSSELDSKLIDYKVIVFNNLSK